MLRSFVAEAGIKGCCCYTIWTTFLSLGFAKTGPLGRHTFTKCLKETGALVSTKSTLELATTVCCLGNCMDTELGLICNVQGVLAMLVLMFWRLAVNMTSKKQLIHA